MSFKSICPHCKQHYELEDDIQGQVAQCTKCQKDFTLTAVKEDDSTPIATNEEMKRLFAFVPYLGAGILVFSLVWHMTSAISPHPFWSLVVVTLIGSLLGGICVLSGFWVLPKKSRKWLFLFLGMAVLFIIINIFFISFELNFFAPSLIIILGWFVFWLAIPNEYPESFVICPNPNCGFRGEVKPQDAAHGCIWVPLILLGIIPGLLYIIACGGMHKIICPKCGMRIR